MPYQAAINRTSPTCFIFLIDQSGSMQEPIMGIPGNPSKADFVADSINKVIQELILYAHRDDGVRRFYQIGAYGYGKEVVSLFDYLSEGEDLVWIDDLAETPRRIEIREKIESDGMGGVVKLPAKFPVWIEPRAKGRTPMCEALAKTKAVLEKWVNSNPNSFPPTEIIVTDGEATDGNPIALAQELNLYAQRMVKCWSSLCACLQTPSQHHWYALMLKKPFRIGYPVPCFKSQALCQLT